MMIAVHAQHVLFKKLMQGRALYYIYPVAHSVVGRRHMMICLRGVLRRQILIQTSAKSRIHKLYPTAYAKGRYIIFHRQTEKLTLHIVPVIAYFTAEGACLFAVYGRRHVLTACKKYSAAKLCQLGYLSPVSGQRKHDGQRTRSLKPTHIAGYHPVGVSFTVKKGHNTDNRSVHKNTSQKQKPPLVIPRAALLNSGGDGGIRTLVPQGAS